MIIEACTGVFYRADRVESKGAPCYVIDLHKFRIIRDSWNKTERQDSRNMVKACWVYTLTGEFGIPTVYKPDVVTRELRKLFGNDALREYIKIKDRNLENTIRKIIREELKEW